MVDQQLVNYIRAEQARGYDEETLRKYLIKLGHDPLNVNEAITIVRKQKEILQPFPQQNFAQQPPLQNLNFKNRQNTSRMATASLIFGLLFFIPLAPILALIFGIASLSSIKKNNLNGKGMALGGIILGLFFILATALICIYFFFILGKGWKDITIIMPF